jgi:hypothetical protein
LGLPGCDKGGLSQDSLFEDPRKDAVADLLGLCLAAGDNKIHFFVGELRFRFYSPAVLADKTGE